MLDQVFAIFVLGLLKSICYGEDKTLQIFMEMKASETEN